MRSIINKISQAVQVVLLAPIKLPGKALNILKYVAVGLGILESVLDVEKRDTEGEDQQDKSEKVIIGSIDVGEQAEEETDKEEERDE
ncbi:hypothetical protein FAZ19_15565 [Sphingobacterium alkalisoli]|uniref:Uncharacterized protein n=1 Tax=Sphingobacterium alkalisoli TaxID=1874115 RepID=A0A4U0GX49_9SPHI|nr:hypothetical protein [Sphingobacterium alkalisoli]TJY63693.1 hypothetical protein FAZ19_15565 [Sphingobacterium alkalisoli]GGH25515.1 hypothetical protein GCM10011418_34150 [Sphingobacterium alkalisoli]